MAELHPLQLPEKYARQVRDLLHRHIPRAEVWAYGSRVWGDCYEASDLDLVVRFPARAEQDLFCLDRVKESFVESHLPIIVQLVDWDSIPESFREEILAGYVVVQKGAGKIAQHTSACPAATSDTCERQFRICGARSS